MPKAVTNHSTPDEKIALFRSLFRGREDVYPQRFESQRTGKSGYSPACANEWVRGVCEKPGIKCANCQFRKFLPVTDDVVRCHLTGSDSSAKPFVLGVYPMLLDETCFFLAVDFDGDDWSGDTRAYLETCKSLNVPAALERSRSGNGGHVWLFFSEAVPATLARKLGSHILTETMESYSNLGFRSYDRFFPNQDTLPKGGFGNLIALPLQHHPREAGNSVFVDENTEVWEDQWQFLSEIKTLTGSEIEAIVDQATAKGKIIGVRRVEIEDDFADSPWSAPASRSPKEKLSGELPQKLKLVLGDQIYIRKSKLSPALKNRIVRLAAFQNPEFYKAQAMRLPTYDKPRIISCSEDLPKHIALPRGCLEELCEFLKNNSIRPVLKDKRNMGEPIDFVFQGKLRSDQRLAADAILAHDNGVLSATTAFGKTVVAAWLIAARGTNTLILVHRKQLMEQWVERLCQFLDIEEKEIGRLGGGRKKLRGKIDIAILQSVVRKGVVDDRIADYGHIIIDECHHLSASSFELAVRRAKAKYITALSATLTRKDGHQPIIFMQCGPIRHHVDAKSEAEKRPFTHHVIVRPTGFDAALDPVEDDSRIQFQQIYGQLVEDESRNKMICGDVEKAVQDGRFPLVLTERTNHLEKLAGSLEGRGIETISLRGGMTKRELSSALETLSSSDPKTIVATGRFIGEGFDESRLDTLFLTLPVSWRGTIAQYAGRLHRLHDGKREVQVYDYADLNVPMLSRMFDRRCQGYEAVGYTILLPASVLPGWPIEVPLPVSPKWKQDYAASVRRLVRDGVDQSLADLFVHVARSFDSDAKGADRARSASEAFFYRRLQTLEATRDKFHLNQDLPIPFCGHSTMEVDFLDPELRIVVELDGQQHLGNRDAYRRDRRKDNLLQENGYRVLRFLAEDMGLRLDEILDEVLRAITFRK